MTENRASILAEDRGFAALRDAISACRERYPFVEEAFVVLPDHLHTIWSLPPGDADYSKRWSFIKAAFTRAWLAAGGQEQPRSASRIANERRGAWQRRFWEHAIRDDKGYRRRLDYIHYNPVKHRVAACPHAWTASSFARAVAEGAYPKDWCCTCDGSTPPAPDFGGLDPRSMERQAVRQAGPYESRGLGRLSTTAPLATRSKLTGGRAALDRAGQPR